MENHGFTRGADELIEHIRNELVAVPEGAVRLDLTTLARFWECTSDEAERLLCEAALKAELAIAFVDETFCDVMTREGAEAVLDRSEAEWIAGPLH